MKEDEAPRKSGISKTSHGQAESDDEKGDEVTDEKESGEIKARLPKGLQDECSDDC